MVPKYPAARARINRNGSDSSGSEISCDTGMAGRTNGGLKSQSPRPLSYTFSRKRGRVVEGIYVPRHAELGAHCMPDPQGPQGLMQSYLRNLAKTKHWCQK